MDGIIPPQNNTQSNDPLFPDREEVFSNPNLDTFESSPQQPPQAWQDIPQEPVQEVDEQGAHFEPVPVVEPDEETDVENYTDLSESADLGVQTEEQLSEESSVEHPVEQVQPANEHHSIPSAPSTENREQISVPEESLTEPSIQTQEPQVMAPLDSPMDSNLSEPVEQSLADSELTDPAEHTPQVADEDLVLETPTEKVSYQNSSIQEIEIARVVPNPYQPRKEFKPEALKELSDSIREHGVIQPIVVTATATGYEIVVGERRFRASQLAGLLKIPAIVKQSLGDQTKLEVALIENIQRQELNSIEEAQAYKQLMDKFKLTQAQVAKKVGKSRPAVANTLRLLNLPAEIQRAIIEGKITEGHGRAILGLQDTSKQHLMFAQVVDKGMSVRQVESRVREIMERKKLDAARPDPKLMAVETELRSKLGTQVKVSRQGRGGKITIDFFSDQDLDDILDKLAEHKEQPTDQGYLTV